MRHRALRKASRLLVLVTMALVLAPDAAGAEPADAAFEGTIVYGSCEGGTNRYGCVVSPTGHDVGVDEATVNTAPEVFFRSPDGTDRRLTYNNVQESGLVLSPSGSSVAFSGAGWDGSCRVYTMSLAGGPMVPVTPHDEWACATVEDWSSDGEWLLVSLYWPEARWNNLYKVRPDGSDFTQITNFCDDFTGAWEAFWARGSDSIIMDATVARPRGRYTDGLHGVDSDGGDLRVLRDVELVDVVFGPTARSVFVATYPPGKRDGEIYELDLQGNILRRVTHNRVDEEQLTFSPDGSKLLFAATTQDTRGERPARGRVLDLSTGRVTPLHLPAFVQLDPIFGFDWVWSPDGTKVAVRAHELDWTDRIVWTSVETRAFGEAVEERPSMRLFGWLP